MVRLGFAMESSRVVEDGAKFVVVGTRFVSSRALFASDRMVSVARRVLPVEGIEGLQTVAVAPYARSSRSACRRPRKASQLTNQVTVRLPLRRASCARTSYCLPRISALTGALPVASVLTSVSAPVVALTANEEIVLEPEFGTYR